MLKYRIPQIVTLTHKPYGITDGKTCDAYCFYEAFGFKVHIIG